MSQNKTIKQGDLVRYHIKSKALDDLGFVLGQFYMVRQSALGLSVSSESAPQLNVNLTDLSGDLTDYADHFTKHRCPVTLPIGELNKRGLA